MITAVAHLLTVTVPTLTGPQSRRARVRLSRSRWSSRTTPAAPHIMKNTAKAGRKRS